jgi:colicin import membrane protein
MSDTEEWEKSVQQVLLPSEDSDNRTLVEMPPKKKLTVSHINKKLEDYHGEMRTEQQTLVEWVLQKEKEEQARERRAEEERLQRERREHEKEVRRREKEQREKRNARKVKTVTKRTAGAVRNVTK